MPELKCLAATIKGPAKAASRRRPLQKGIHEYILMAVEWCSASQRRDRSTMRLEHPRGNRPMALFFFIIALELKRELVLDELRNPRVAALPIAAALGGMVVPAGPFCCWSAAKRVRLAGAPSRPPTPPSSSGVLLSFCLAFHKAYGCSSACRSDTSSRLIRSKRSFQKFAATRS